MHRDHNRIAKTPAERTAAGEARLSRRSLLAAGVAGLGASLLAPSQGYCDQSKKPTEGAAAPVPRVDLHVHLDNSTIDEVLALGRKLDVKFGIVEHAGTEENDYPVVLSSDEELGAYLKMLEDKPCFCGVQAEWLDWSSCFSEKMLDRLDFVLMDAMTYPGNDGSRVKLWQKDVESVVEMSDRQSFMDRYVDFHVKLFEKQPMDILGNASWLPKPLAPDYEAFWTKRRVRRVATAAAKRNVAIEIGSRLELPKRYFLEIALAEGAKLSFGSNGRYPNMGQLDYCLEMAGQLGLGREHIFVPGRG